MFASIVLSSVAVSLSSSITDAGVGALCGRTAVMGAFMNVKINAGGMDDKAYVENILNLGNEIQANAIALEAEVCALVEAKM